MKWISIQERLPENAILVFIYSAKPKYPNARDYNIGFYRLNKWVTAMAEVPIEQAGYKVTHWYPAKPPEPKTLTSTLA
jgi:hypothetical protein